MRHINQSETLVTNSPRKFGQVQIPLELWQGSPCQLDPCQLSTTLVLAWPGLKIVTNKL